MNIHFKKMHGLGNDMIILDGRENGLTLTPEQARHIADRRRGVGCDLIVLMKHSKNWQETTFVHLINSDGTEIEACGNGTRCVADLLMSENNVDNIIIETLYGGLNCFREDSLDSHGRKRQGGGQVRVEMGKPQLGWQDIPLSQECDTLHLPLEGDPVGVNIGNPHCVFFVDFNNASGEQARYGCLDDWPDELLEEQGLKTLENPLFPRQTNVEFVEVLSRTHLRMRVRERGCGITQACGSAACGVAVAAIRRGLTERKMTVTLDGGDLIIAWPSDDAPVSMTGPVTYVFDGVLEEL